MPQSRWNPATGNAPDGKTAAVKVIHADLARDPEFRRRFRREVETTAAITGQMILSWNDSHYCLLNHGGSGASPDDCTMSNTSGLPDNAFWWTIS